MLAGAVALSILLSLRTPAASFVRPIVGGLPVHQLEVSLCSSTHAGRAIQGVVLLVRGSRSSIMQQSSSALDTAVSKDSGVTPFPRFYAQCVVDRLVGVLLIAWLVGSCSVPAACGLLRLPRNIFPLKNIPAHESTRYQ